MNDLPTLYSTSYLSKWVGPARAKAAKPTISKATVVFIVADLPHHPECTILKKFPAYIPFLYELSTDLSVRE